MHERFGTVSEREKETLRLLLHGHDAKSIAAALGLSVHTVNERLREARRKLGVTSSREAARLLAEVERPGPNILGDKQIGVAATQARGKEHGQSEKPARGPQGRVARRRYGDHVRNLSRRRRCDGPA